MVAQKNPSAKLRNDIMPGFRLIRCRRPALESLGNDVDDKKEHLVLLRAGIEPFRNEDNLAQTRRHSCPLFTAVGERNVINMQALTTLPPRIPPVLTHPFSLLSGSELTFQESGRSD